MKITTLMLRQHHRIQELLALIAESRSARQSLLQHVLEYVARFFRLQTEVFEPAVEPWVGATVRMRMETRTRAQIALFRLATAAPDTLIFCRYIEELRDVLRAHALHQGSFLRALEREVAAPILIRLGRQLEFQ